MKLISLCKLNLKKYILELLLLVMIIFTLFVPSIYVRTVLAVLLLVYTVIITKLHKKVADTPPINSRKVKFIMLIFAVIYVVGYYILGLYFEYYKNPISLTLNTIASYILPLLTIVILSEILRKLFISKEDKISNILITIIMVILEVALYSQVYDIKQLDDFLTILGLIIFSSISCNLLYDYICIKFGAKPIIIYRIITVLFIYILPIIPNVPNFFRATLRIIYPYIMYVIFEYMYGQEQIVVSKNNKKVRIVNSIIVLVVTIILTMLVSCKFSIGILAIGSGSMSSTINKGDAVVFTKYKNQEIKIGDIVLFQKNEKILVHRVIETEINNNEEIYYTKGDNNNTQDEGFITSSDIIGIYKFKIKYIGHPTLWLSDIF